MPVPWLVGNENIVCLYTKQVLCFKVRETMIGIFFQSFGQSTSHAAILISHMQLELSCGNVSSSWLCFCTAGFKTSCLSLPRGNGHPFRKSSGSLASALLNSSVVRTSKTNKQNHQTSPKPVPDPLT